MSHGGFYAPLPAAAVVNLDQEIFCWLLAYVTIPSIEGSCKQLEDNIK